MAASTAKVYPIVNCGADPRRRIYHDTVDRFCVALIEHYLRASYGSRTTAAAKLGLTRSYLQRLIRQYEIRVPVHVWPVRTLDHFRRP